MGSPEFSVSRHEVLASDLGHRLEALHADLDATRSAFDEGFDGAKVREEDSLVHVMSVGDSVTRYRVLSADFTGFRHLYSSK